MKPMTYIPQFYARNLIHKLNFHVSIFSVFVFASGLPPVFAQDATNKQDAAARPALTVAMTLPQSSNWPQLLTAHGDISAWQEAIIGAELVGFRVSEILVDIGDTVRKDQVLARLHAQAVNADVAQANAAIAEAEAALAEARSNAGRTRDLSRKGFVSSHELTQAATSEQTALARLAAASARLLAEETRLAQTRILAPDDGIISARTAAVGSLTQAGQELFKLIRGHRLEWRAEVISIEVNRITPGMVATLTLPDGTQVPGKVRVVGPTVDPHTRTAKVYVDLPTDTHARMGMFAQGTFALGHTPALTVPQTAVLLRDGFAYVFRLENQNKVVQTKVAVGRRVQDRIEITEGLDPSSPIVAAGVGFLADGDTVHVVEHPDPITERK